jgi:hypothetical protein
MQLERPAFVKPGHGNAWVGRSKNKMHRSAGQVSVRCSPGIACLGFTNDGTPLVSRLSIAYSDGSQPVSAVMRDVSANDPFGLSGLRIGTPAKNSATIVAEGVCNMLE